MISLGEIALKEATDTTVELRNTTDHPLRIYGANQRCAANYCIYVLDLPERLLPGEHKQVVVRYVPRKPGSFEEELTLFVENQGNPHLVVCLRGHAL